MGGALLVLIVLGGYGAVLLGVHLPWEASSKVEPSKARAELNVELVAEAPHTLSIPEDVRKSLGITANGLDKVEVARHPTHSREFVLPGSTALDPTRLYRIRARFAPARVVEIAPQLRPDGTPIRDDAASLKEGRTMFRELRTGNTVKKGQLLAVFYSVDVGNKKNDLIDALSQRYLDEEILEKAEKAFRGGALPEIYMLNAQRNVEADRNAERRAVNNLRTWDIPEDEIKACYDEARRISKLNSKERDLARVEKNDLWPVVKLVAPDDGVIIERNVAQQEMVVDGTTNLFQIATVDRMLILANCPEDDLHTLQSLNEEEMRWTLKTVGADPTAGIEGRIDEISYLIDPNQHTGVIKGHIDNPGGKLRAGQFVSAAIQLPPPREKVNGGTRDLAVEVPIDAVSEDGQMCVVFVQTDAARHHYTMRRVKLLQRFEKTAFVCCTPVSEKEQPTAEEEKLGMLRIAPLLKGERVLTTAVGELKAVLIDKESQPKKTEEGTDK